MRQTLLAACGALALAFAAAPAQALEVVDKATLEWEAAPGPVAGYYVIVARNGAAPKLEGVSDNTSSDVLGAPGDSAVVQVAAFGADGAAGPLSEPSEPIDFVSAPPDPGSGGGGSDPGDGSGGGGSDPGDGSGGGGDGSDPGSGGGGTGVAHDFSCDGRSDLIVRAADGSYRIWEMVGEQVARKIDLPTASALDALVGAGDYDGDGCADLLWQDRDTGLLSVWTLDAGQYVSRQVLDATALPAQDDWRVGGSGDLDGDGVDDILLYSLALGEAEVWTMRDGAVLDVARLTGRSGDWGVPSLIDGDGDGDFEVLWYASGSRRLEHLDPATGAEIPLWKVHKNWVPLAAADFDGDGAGEVLVHNSRRGGAAALETIEGGGVGEVMWLPDARTLGEAAGFADYDGDGTDDVVWVEPDSGVVTMWLEAGERQRELAELLEPGASVVEARGTVD